ncbi:hypothetical protein AVEN_79622-1 [Araneus ventricosus]|uniref:Uncharacterized protein n=1 Tax=Araneus ventricosus TaxID=182803 RepID=A0A4Y2PZA9_ARAVE|nr:hypothetical protein AVEN_201380-1 [Araneus ventricosus]GBN58837.1 hypothetical protein AVEN_79622-1 [Araneus ventricosus]
MRDRKDYHNEKGPGGKICKRDYRSEIEPQGDARRACGHRAFTNQEIRERLTLTLPLARSADTLTLLNLWTFIHFTSSCWQEFHEGLLWRSLQA